MKQTLPSTEIRKRRTIRIGKLDISPRMAGFSTFILLIGLCVFLASKNRTEVYVFNGDFTENNEKLPKDIQAKVKEHLPEKTEQNGAMNADDLELDYEPEPIPSKSVGSTKSVNQKPKKKVVRFNLSGILSAKTLKKNGATDEEINEARKNCYQYVERFEKVARAEMKKYGIPASITLAQGLLESDAGFSSLATQSNNHFGIKCKSKCKGCTCRNYSDDDVYDMFRVFGSAWESYREHSLVLRKSRYTKRTKNLSKTDYKGWAKALKAGGYATAKNYDTNLIRIIEKMKLYKYDE